MTGTGPMKIRPCTNDDFPEVLVLLGQLWPGVELDPARLTHVFESYLDAEADLPFCAAVAGRVVGFASLNIRNSLWRSGRIAYLDILVVDEAHQRQGIGAAMLDRAASLAGDLGCAYLELDSGFQRPGAHAFYESQGFESFGIMFGKRLRLC
ncbi:MAG: GNAT family N-acetyltransferase [Candidatus Geothermincolia bacterium]